MATCITTTCERQAENTIVYRECGKIIGVKHFCGPCTDAYRDGEANISWDKTMHTGQDPSEFVMSSAEYASNEAQCPVCRSPDLGSDEPRIAGYGLAYIPTDCYTCGAHWNEVYHIKGYVNLEYG